MQPQQPSNNGYQTGNSESQPTPDQVIQDMNNDMANAINKPGSSGNPGSILQQLLNELTGGVSGGSSGAGVSRGHLPRMPKLKIH